MILREVTWRAGRPADESSVWAGFFTGACSEATSPDSSAFNWHVSPNSTLIVVRLSAGSSAVIVRVLQNVERGVRRRSCIQKPTRLAKRAAIDRHVAEYPHFFSSRQGIMWRSCAFRTHVAVPGRHHSSILGSMRFRHHHASIQSFRVFDQSRHTRPETLGMKVDHHVRWVLKPSMNLRTTQHASQATATSIPFKSLAKWRLVRSGF